MHPSSCAFYRLGSPLTPSVRPACPISEPASPPPGDVAPRLRAALDLVRIDTEFHRSGGSLFGVLGGPFRPGEHYPPGEVWDAETHAQYFYHAHPERDREPGEHGHFHLFLGQGGMPAGLTPLVLPEMGLAPQSRLAERADPGTHRSVRDRGVFSHLIAISIDPHGRPVALFTTNRWVTGETWYRAEDVIRMLDRFDFAVATAGALDRWLAAVLRVLKPAIIELVQARDSTIMDWRRRRSRQLHVFDDRRLEIVSQRRIDFAAELEALLGDLV
ncbi:MAG: hypothetical protein QOJ54_674 [Aliidongia sp.]|nr:hypothetical protein [Aliidongia sp.]